MNNRFLLLFCGLIIFLCFGSSYLASAQQQGKNTAYVFTYTNPGSLNGTAIKIVDLNSGLVSIPFFDDKQPFQVLNARNGQLVRNSAGIAAADSFLLPMATSVAAAAYDEKHNRLYYTPMGINQLRYADLNKKTVTFNYIQDQAFGTTQGITDVPNQVTRMVIDGKGTGYALSNDGNHLLKFSTDQNTVTDLGAIKDDPSTTTVSVHSSCTSAGGDMVLDASNNLLLVAANNYVFYIDTKSMVASYKGQISGLPVGFTSNGAAVNSNGELVVSCAIPINANAYYKIDISSLHASPIEHNGSVINAADMANANVLGQQATNPKLALASTAKDYMIYPNPVKDGFFKLTLSNYEKGDYQLQVMDILGLEVNRISITVQSSQQVERIDISSFKAQGVYVIRMVNKDQGIEFSKKIMIIRD